MQYTNEIKQEILRMKSFGSSSREIAEALNISKSGVNDFLNSGEKPKVEGPRVLFLDLETAPATVVTFGRFNVNISQDHVIKEGHYMLTAAWSWLGSDTVYDVKLKSNEAVNGDDSRIAASLYEAIEDSDIVVAHNCVEKTTKVLKKDLTWVEAGTLKEGDEIIAFSEGSNPYNPCRVNGEWNKVGKAGRNIKIAKVTSNFIEKKPCMKVTLSNGDSIITTYDHYWLAMAEKDKNLRWYQTAKLRVGQRVNKYLNVWNKDKSYEAGWLSGFISGEGSLVKNNGVVQGIQACQRPGETWDRFIGYSKKLGFNVSESRNPKTGGLGKQDCLYANYLGGKFTTLEIIGKLDIQRMKNNIDFDNLGKLKTPVNEVTVVSVEDVGLMEVAVLSTSEKTFFAGGYPMHNCNRFDMPVIKTRLLANGFPPHKTVKMLDTLKMAKHFRFPSNKLDSIGAYLKLGRKIDTGGIDLWVRCINGDSAALAEMSKYNIQDVVLLKEVYNKLAAFNSGTANFGNYYDDDKHHCPACGSTAVTETGNFVYTPVSKFEEVVCNDCGHRSRLRTAVNTKEQRKKALVTPKVTG